MEQELIGLIQAVKDVAPSVWQAARWATVTGAWVDAAMAVALFAGAVTALLWVGRGEWADKDFAYVFGGGPAVAVAAGAGLWLGGAIRVLLAPDWYTIQLLMRQLPGN